MNIYHSLFLLNSKLKILILSFCYFLKHFSFTNLLVKLIHTAKAIIPINSNQFHTLSSLFLGGALY
jgi:hypothetical protein